MTYDYSQIRYYLGELELHPNNIRAQIALCVSSSLDSHRVKDDTFNALCTAVYNVWSDLEIGYTQRISDIIVNAYLSKYLTKKELLNIPDKKFERISEEFYEIFYI